MRDIFEMFDWHSGIGIDDALVNNRKFVTRMANTRRARSHFITAGDNLLVHRATKALWRISDDGNSIEPVFETDVLSEDDLKE